jgi:hypothetical protein
VLWLRRDAAHETLVTEHLPWPRCGGVPLAEGFSRHAAGLPICSLQCLPMRADLLVQPVRRGGREDLAGVLIALHKLCSKTQKPW